MAGSTSKKVVITRFDRESVSGFVNPQNYLLPDGVEVLTPLGARSVIPYPDIKTVCFVKVFEESEGLRERRLFNSRPKMEGLWVRMSFRDGEVMDGLLANNLLAIEMYGFTVAPADPSSRQQKVFVPRTALREFAVVGVVGSPLRRQKPKPEIDGQGKLFE